MASNPPRAHLRRLVRAPAADVFGAWTDPAVMALWLSPVGSATASVDLRIGGRFQLVMADEHLSIEHTGEYRVIEPPRLLVFTWRSEFTGMRDTLVTVRLTEHRPGETELELTHEFSTDAEASSHAGGWGQILHRLESYLESRGEDSKNS
jgi:uncharacterized protein YndB with AHSA1/START domain